MTNISVAKSSLRRAKMMHGTLMLPAPRAARAGRTAAPEAVLAVDDEEFLRWVGQAALPPSPLDAGN